MQDNKELIELVKRAYEEQKTRYIKEKELLAWLRGNGLAVEQAKAAIDLAIKQSVIRFCYPSSISRSELVPCYERITEEDLLPPELVEEIRGRVMQRELKRTKKSKETK